MKLILFFLLISFSVLTAADIPDFSDQTNLLEISKTLDIPSKKLAEYLNLDSETDSKIPLAELGITNDKIKNAYTAYQEEETVFFGDIVLVGMSIVFISLILVGLIILSLQHLEIKKKPKTSRTANIPEHISSNAIVAAITAIYIHEAEVEEQNRLNLTWTRSQLSMWRATNMVENRFFERRGNR
jgi:hypothetical protein